jgi:hypothetical protein
VATTRGGEVVRLAARSPTHGEPVVHAALASRRAKERDARAHITPAPTSRICIVESLLLRLGRSYRTRAALNKSLPLHPASSVTHWERDTSYGESK